VIAFPLHRVRRKASSAIFSAFQELDEHESQLRLHGAWVLGLSAVLVLSALVVQHL
jgi:hypothetical protein